MRNIKVLLLLVVVPVAFAFAHEVLASEYGVGMVNQPPVANAGPDPTVPVQSDSCLARVQLDGSSSYDPDGDPLTYTWAWGSSTATGPNPMISLPLGLFAITLTVEDGFGGISTDEVVVAVVDSTPPVIQGITANPNILWPPNHQYVQVNFTVQSKDNCDQTPVSQISSMSSSEPVDGLGDGNTVPDWMITGTLTSHLRAERAGTGDGRIYTATIYVTDDSGNIAWGTVDIQAPKK